MVVLVILGVLAALIVPNVLDRTDDARVTAARTDVNNLMQALRLYKAGQPALPPPNKGSTRWCASPPPAPVPPNWKPYLDKLPARPLGPSVPVREPGRERARSMFFSYGADGQPGGEGKNADIGSWQ